MFRGNLQHTGVYEAAGVPKFTAVKWKFKTAGRVVSSPAVVADTVYVGSTDHNLYAVDRAAGTEKWKFTAGSRVTSSPAVAAGIVYFVSMDGNFYAIDAASGKLKWKFKTGGERRYTATHLHGAEPALEAMPDPFDFYTSSPAVAGGKVYFGSGDGSVYALDAASGELKWSFKTGDVVHSSPAVADGVVYIGGWDTFFYALDANTGKEKWRLKTGDDPQYHNQIGVQSSPAIVDGMVYFGCRDSNLYAVDAATGEKKWAFNNKGSWVIGSPAISKGKLYFATSDSGMFYALDTKTGAEIFHLEFTWPMFASPAIAGSTLYLGSNEGKLTAIDLATQKPAWVFQTDASRQFAPGFSNPKDGKTNYEAVIHDFYYDDMVIAVDKLLTVGAFLSSPAVVDKTIYIGSTDGYLYALQ